MARTGWPAIPGPFGKPWFLPIVGAYYRLQDCCTRAFRPQPCICGERPARETAMLLSEVV